MRTSKQKPLTVSTYDKLVQHIVSGKCKPGEPISELALTKELGVSRTPIHNAVLQLSRDGLIYQEPNHRPVVRGLTPGDIHKIYEMRILLEGESARLSAALMPKSQLNKLIKVHYDVEAFEGDRDEWLQLWMKYDNAFHVTLANYTGNRLLGEDLSRYRLLLRGLNLSSLCEKTAPLTILRSAIAEHAHILHAINHGNQEAARDSMRMHLRRWQEYFADLFKREAEAIENASNLLVLQKAIQNG
jgi:DNA-binding GntR family transcriptional regulator